MNPILQKASWMESGDIRPYVFVRPENSIANPGARHQLDWFIHEPIYKNPLSLDELPFAEHIYDIEGKAFGPSNMAMPRWVFYDCSVVPGFVAGFACRTSKLPAAFRAILPERPGCEWTPLSLFIIIPSMHKGEWVAHNLCTINSLVKDKSDQLYGLGFLSKAFGLWYANVEQCTGFTQWGSPALKLHSHFGYLEVVGAYAPVHSHAETITYRANISTACWEKFFTREEDMAFLENYEPTEIMIDPREQKSMIDLQRKIERHEGPFYLNASEIAGKDLSEKLTIYRPKKIF
ncbi:MAG: hypothetical protein KF802_03880 [Bdellovibrionaceae bacterium]|nr:hypothetical protein [Pseudobdellovibrionaceae bacterium]MBX3035195.1 hypothetical protein [Pseudobdellovibrionaceae bacterium]